jgi:hypothetical protein
MVMGLDVENASFFPRQLDSEMRKHKQMKMCSSVVDCGRGCLLASGELRVTSNLEATGGSPSLSSFNAFYFCNGYE